MGPFNFLWYSFLWYLNFIINIYFFSKHKKFKSNLKSTQTNPWYPKVTILSLMEVTRWLKIFTVPSGSCITLLWSLRKRWIWQVIQISSSNHFLNGIRVLSSNNMLSKYLVASEVCSWKFLDQKKKSLKISDWA